MKLETLKNWNSVSSRLFKAIDEAQKQLQAEFPLFQRPNPALDPLPQLKPPGKMSSIPNQSALEKKKKKGFIRSGTMALKKMGSSVIKGLMYPVKIMNSDNFGRRAVTEISEESVIENSPEKIEEKKAEESPKRKNEEKREEMAKPAIANQDLNEKLLCGICFEKQKDYIFNCGHMFCEDHTDFQKCPFCNAHVESKLKLYF